MLEKLRFKKLRSVKTPERANTIDAGLDFFVPEDLGCILELNPGESVLIASGIALEIPVGYAGIFNNKSSIGIQGLLVGAQVVDAGYIGEIYMNIHNVSTDILHVVPGKKILQLILHKIETPKLIEIAEHEPFINYESTRGVDSRLGSTGD